MAAPTARFRLIPQNTVVAALDTPGERLGGIPGESVISTGDGNEVDWGTLDISGGAANSGVKTMLWDITANQGHSAVSDFKLWCSSIGFDIAGSVVKVQPLCGDDGTPVNTEKYIADAVVGSYSWATMVEAEPGAQNVWPTDEGSSMDISGGVSVDVIMWALYLAIASGETAGTYKGVDPGDPGKELQFSHKFSYS